jgi:glucosamine kinase
VKRGSMSNGPESDSPLFLGVDGGGTKCRAVIAGADGTVRGTGRGGPANPFQGFEQSIRSILAATEEALASAGLAPDAIRTLHACLGLAGVNLPAIHARVTQWPHPFRHLLVATDLRIACIGAHRGEDGAVIIAGTGSCGYSTVQGRETVLGGHGFPPGDKGSGAWIGLEAVKHVLLALDGMAGRTELSERILNAMQARDALSLIERLGDHGAGAYARFAPLVLSAAANQDAVATEIVRDGALYLTELARRLWATHPPRMSLIGGLAHPLLPWLSEDVVALLSPALEPPEMGSVRLAMQHWQRGNTNPNSISTAGASCTR